MFLRVYNCISTYDNHQNVKKKTQRINHYNKIKCCYVIHSMLMVSNRNVKCDQCPVPSVLILGLSLTLTFTHMFSTGWSTTGNGSISLKTAFSLIHLLHNTVKLDIYFCLPSYHNIFFIGIKRKMFVDLKEFGKILEGELKKKRR